MAIREKIFFALPYVIITFLVLLLFGKGCGGEKVIDNLTAEIEKIEAEKTILKSQKAELLLEVDELFDVNDSLAERAENIKSKVVKGKERVKYLSETVKITDTLVIEYTDAMKGQINDLETLVEVKDSTINNQKKIIEKKDSLTANVEKTAVLTEKQLAETSGKLEEVKSESKKKDRKITALKIQRVLYPVATAAGFIWLMLSK
jgi:hypothetical protein